MPCGTPFEQPLYRYRFGVFCLFEQPADCGARDPVSLRDVGQTVAPVAVPKDGNPVDLESDAGRYACPPAWRGASLPVPVR